MTRTDKELEQERKELEAEEAAYLRWIMSDGPARSEEKHAAMADECIASLTLAGWKILSRELRREVGEDFDKVEIVARHPRRRFFKGLPIVLRWVPFNRFWMRDTGSGRVGVDRSELGI